MKFILRRSEEVGKVELPITAVIIDENGRCIGRGSNKREINNDPLGHAELIALITTQTLRPLVERNFKMTERFGFLIFCENED